jgi:hypothetical protein
MATKSRRKRHRILALIAAGAMALVVALVVAVVWIMIRQPDKTDTAVPPSAVPPSVPTTPGTKPRPEFQDASCPDVQLISIPGTWESSPQLDPFNPTQFPIALLLNVTNPIRQQFGTDRLEVYTVPYTAQFHNPLSADGQMNYNDSRAEGAQNAVKAMTDMNNRCPLTSYVQAMGLTMTGPRPGGFGSLNDRTNEICATGDLICSAPEEAFSITNLPRTLEILGGGAGQPVHAMYATTQFWNLGGQPATAWTLDWARQVVDAAPHPKHG